MEFRILGPLEIRAADGRRCPLEPRLARLLAALLLSDNQVLGRQQLIDAIWGDNPPVTSPRQLRNLVWALRHRLAGAGAPAATIVTDGAGYRIALRDTGIKLDAQVFTDRVDDAQRLMSRGQLADAARQLRAGLRLWRGPALAGTAAGWVAAGAVRLDERRLTATEQCVELELRLGRHHELVGELTELAIAHPLRERFVGQLMVALHRCGRQADALAAYQRLRARLADDLGIDPGRTVQDLHTAILRNLPDSATQANLPGSATQANLPDSATQGKLPDSATHAPQAGAGTAPRPVPRQLPAPVRYFVGRAAELKDLTRLADEANDEGPVVISAISGSGGIGKTALALHWAHRVAYRFPDGQLYLNLRGFDPSGSPMTPAEATRNLLDALQVPPERVPATLDAQAGLYRSLVAGRRILVLLDNARDSDQVRPLLPGSPGCLALVTSRSLLADLQVAEAAHPIILDLLTAAEARDLLTARLGPERLAAEPGAVDDLVGQCTGLPLALSIVAARAAAHPRFRLAGLAAELTGTRERLDALDTGGTITRLRTVFSWSYHQITPAAARLFRLLSVHPGPEISAAAAASLVGAPAARLRPLLLELTGANLITERLPGRYAFHDLLRAYATELAGATDGHGERAGAVRRLLDHYLHTAYTAARVRHPSRQRFVPAAAAPGVAPEPLTDEQQALGWFIAEHRVLLAAVKLASTAGADRHTYQLAWCLTDFLDWRGHWHDWAAVQVLALDAARRLDDPAAQALALRGLAGARFRQGEYETAYRHLSLALDLVDRGAGPVDQVEVRVNIATACGRLGRYDEALSHAHQALRIARDSGDQIRESGALHSISWTNTLRGDHRQAVSYGRRALALQRVLGNREGEAATLDGLGLSHHKLGDHSAAIGCFEQSLVLCRVLGNRYYEANGLVHLGDAQHAGGDPDAARTAWRAALEILDELGHPEAGPVRDRLSGRG